LLFFCQVETDKINVEREKESIRYPDFSSNKRGKFEFGTANFDKNGNFDKKKFRKN